jgi:phospholipid/cholesterol/gamma-HCH transport system substrate-binding protein
MSPATSIFIPPPASSSPNRRDFYTGLFLLVSILLLVGAYLRSSMTHFTRNVKTYYADGTDIAGLEEGSDVEMGGYKIGVIRHIRVLNDPTLRFELELAVRKDVPVPKGWKAVGSNHSLSGDRFLDLRPAAGGADVSAGSVLQAGGHMPVEADATIQMIMTKADQAFANLTEVTAQLDKMVSAGATGPGLKDTFARLSKVLADADAAATAAARMMARLDRTVDKISPSLESGAKSLEGTMQTAESAAHRLDRLLEKEEPKLDQVLASASARLAELKGLSELLAGYDSDKNPAIHATLQHLDGATKSLEDLLADVKAHPWKLVRKGK